MQLRYGDPPLEEDCEDVGEYIVSQTLTMPSTPELQQREKSVIDLVGEPLPDWAKVRIAVKALEKKEKNIKAVIPKVGVLLVGKEGWEVVT